MRRAIAWILLVTVAACQNPSIPRSERVERTLVNVGGPERVFARPVAEFVPLLQQANLAPERGRVGDELVFWTYDMPGGARRWLYACALLPDVDCEARAERVCPTGARTVLAQLEEPGLIVRRHCEAVGQASPGELYPNCTDYMETWPMRLGLLSCGS